jgi:hypothetical protein
MTPRSKFPMHIPFVDIQLLVILSKDRSLSKKEKPPRMADPKAYCDLAEPRGPSETIKASPNADPNEYHSKDRHALNKQVDHKENGHQDHDDTVQAIPPLPPFFLGIFEYQQK